MRQVTFNEYVNIRINKAKRERKSVFNNMLEDISGILNGEDDEDGQQLLTRILFRYRRNRAMRTQVSILVNAYRSYCKGGKRGEDISIRDATKVPFY